MQILAILIIVALSIALIQRQLRVVQLEKQLAGHRLQQEIEGLDKRICELKQQLASAEQKYADERSLANKEIANLLDKNNGPNLHIAQLRGKGK